MNKKKQLQFNLNNFLLSISLVLDLVEKDLKNTKKNHSRRIAFISLKLGERFQLSPQEMADLCAYCLLHNVALKKINEYDKEYFNLAQNLADKLPFLCKYDDVLKYHQEHYDGSSFFGLKENEIPFLSQIISFSHIIDTNFDFLDENVQLKKDIKNFIEENEDKLFSKDISDMFLDISSTVDFWLDIQNENDILFFIFSTLYDFTIEPTFEEVLDITSTFTILNEENENILDKCSKMADFYNFEHKDKQTFLIAASLYNIGKLAIPSKILNKPGNLNESEFEIMKTYPYYTKKILTNLMGFNDISNWASRAQERVDGKGYPYKLSGKDLSLKDRLMAVLNVYQSLTTKKSYRDKYNHKEAINIMLELSEEGTLDKTIVKDVKKQLG
ncbi:HD domain-containing phosphohydrolase [Arcobacter arenosus]|uniref:Phosphohydrolase n=1 Tax=Arcobacter arenosus TaxID=2576037 RepID=A0A5R8XZ92_9BACT|nr:HD domain-containing phosphohydrolase [Arcobacter arenosus]TLP36327.1 phosphohydrolase [Arcobacter arenosus]